MDEYDVPIEKSICNNYYKEMYEVMRAIFSTTLKDNTTLKFAIVTGRLKSIEEIIFTGINDFVSGRIPTTTYDKYYGFTQEDINKFYSY